MNANPKIQTSHLARKAVIYVRQSTLTQVRGNLESQRRQYALTERARQLGFEQIEVIDQDLGRSASGTERRPGFERLVALVLSGEIGAVLCIEASRLARNGRDWHHLMDLCALCDTVIIDPDGVYDPRHSNDRLLLGLNGRNMRRCGKSSSASKDPLPPRCRSGARRLVFLKPESPFRFASSAETPSCLGA